MKKRISASLATTLLLGIFAAASVTAAVPTPGATFPGNYQCPEGSTKIDPVTAGRHDLVEGGSLTIDIQETANGPVFDFSVTFAVVDSIVVKGGPNYHWYVFTPGVTSAQDLHSPLNLKNGKWYGLSHLCFETTKKDPTTGK